MELLDFKHILAKSLIGTCNSRSRSRNTPASNVSHWQVLSVSAPLHLPVLQTMREKCRYCYTFNIIFVEAFCAWFPTIDLGHVLQTSIPKFKDNKHFFCCYSFISSLSFTLGYLGSILFIWVCNVLIKIRNFNNLCNTS